MLTNLTRKEAKEWQDWQDLRARIQTATEIPISETQTQKERRVKKLLKSFPAFCKYYFPHYCSSDFAWFHKQAARRITQDPKIFAILEWPREHAKSVFVNVLLPMFLKAKGELTGMMIGSATQDKAISLLGDIQAELTANKRYKNDFGDQASIGSWQDGEFVTLDGIGFKAFGRGQSPRGTREGEKRPNYGVIDDIDDATIVRNEVRVKEAVDWVLGDFYGALSIEGARMVIAGNRIHKRGILAHLVGDTEPDIPKREAIWHSKVYATETKTHKEASVDEGQPAWPERYSLEDLLDKIIKMGYRNSQREFYHRHIVDGNIFLNDHLTWVEKPKPLHQYSGLVVYVDPSWKGSKRNDFKAVLLIGKDGRYYDILWAWLRQASTAAMVRAHYDLSEILPENVAPRHYMEASFMQDLLLEEYTAEGEARGYQLNIMGDKRKKPDKLTRIESLEPYWERGFLRFNGKERKNRDMITLRDQFLAFPNGPDDGPDAAEGGIFYLNKRARASKNPGRTGKYNRNRQRNFR